MLQNLGNKLHDSHISQMDIQAVEKERSMIIMPMLPFKSENTNTKFYTLFKKSK